MSHLKTINTNAAFDLLFFSANVRGRTIKFANFIVRPRKHIPSKWTPTTRHLTTPSRSVRQLRKLLHWPKIMYCTIPPILCNRYRDSTWVEGRRGGMTNTRALHLTAECRAEHNPPSDCVGVSSCPKTGWISLQYEAATSHRWTEGNGSLNHGRQNEPTN